MLAAAQVHALYSRPCLIHLLFSGINKPIRLPSAHRLWFSLDSDPVQAASTLNAEESGIQRFCMGCTDRMLVDREWEDAPTMRACDLTWCNHFEKCKRFLTHVQTLISLCYHLSGPLKWTCSNWYKLGHLHEISFSLALVDSERIDSLGCSWEDEVSFFGDGIIITLTFERFRSSKMICGRAC